jgi:hypothetical protein
MAIGKDEPKDERDSRHLLLSFFIFYFLFFFKFADPSLANHLFNPI